MEKIAAKYLFFSVEEGILIRNYLRNPIKMVLMLFNYGFRGKMVVFVVKKVKKQSYSRICSYFGGGDGGLVMVVVVVVVVVVVMVVVDWVVVEVVVVLVVIVVVEVVEVVSVVTMFHL